MGDCGSYNAGVAVEFSLKRKKGKNTEEETSAFLNEKKVILNTYLDADEDTITAEYEAGNSITLEYKDWETWKSKSMSLEEMLEALEEYGNYEDEDNYTLSRQSQATHSDVENLDLDAYRTHKLKGLNSEMTHSISILDIYESIYCGNDNSSQDSMKLSKLDKYKDLPDARLVLTGDGNGNC